MPIAQPDFTFDVGTELERLKGQVPWGAPDSSYLGIHGRARPDQNGHSHYDIYSFCNIFFWSACTISGMHRGPRAGPFKSARSAYRAAEEHRYEEDEQ
jgi:hypothetical protein